MLRSILTKRNLKKNILLLTVNRDQLLQNKFLKSPSNPLL